MDWKAEIEAAVQAGVKAAFERYASVEEPMDEMARRRRRYIELAEDTMKRDPVWAEKVARRRAASSTSLASASVVTACALRDGKLVARPPTTCSTQCRSRDVTMSMSATVPAATSVSFRATTSVSTLISSVTPTSCTTTVDIVPLLAGAVISGEAIDINNMGCAASTTVVSLLGGSEDRSDREDPVTMSAQLDTPEGTDTAVTDEDEQLSAGARLERPLVLVTVMDVADDHSFITGTSAMPLTLAALGVDDGHIANKYEVLLPLKLLVPLSRSKELYVSPLLPQCIHAMITLGTSMKQREAKINGMCSGLSYTTANSMSISLFQWDPGEPTIACVKELIEDSSGSVHHYEKPGYASNQLYLPWPIQLSCSRVNVIGKCVYEDICMKLLPYQLDCVGSLCQQNMEHLVACAPTYHAIRAAQVPFEYFLLGFFGNVQKNFQPLYLEASTYLLPTLDSVPYNSAPGTAGLVFPDSSVFLWELASSSLFDVWAIQDTSQLWSYILWSTVYGISPYQKPMEQWHPGTAKGQFCTQDCNVSCHFIDTAVTTEDYLLQSCYVGHICFGGPASFSGEVIAIENPSKCLLYVQSVLTMGIFSTQPRDYVLMLQPRLPYWWYDTPYVQPANGILLGFSWQWITIKHVKVQFQFAFPPFSVHFHVARVLFITAGSIFMSMS